jgi:glutaredoxin
MLLLTRVKLGLFLASLCGTRAFNLDKVCAETLASTAARAPCPRRQLLSYVGHVGGYGDADTAVFARDMDGNIDWLAVGRVAASSDDAAFDVESVQPAIASARAAAQALVRATHLQERLIMEHACRFDPALREAKRRGKLQLGLEMMPGSVSLVPPSAGPADAAVAEMLSVGFVGLTPPAKAAGRPPKGIYADHWAAGGVREYDRDTVRAEIASVLEQSRDEIQPDVVIYAWPHCGFAIKARAALDEAGVAYSNVVVDKFSPQHAELALTTGRPTVPCIFVRGELVGGCDPDESLPGLMGVLEKGTLNA